MSRGLVAGMTDYSHQSFDDIIIDLKNEVKYIEETKTSIESKIEYLISNNYWNKVSWDFKNLVAYSLKFFNTAISELKQINDELPDEVKNHHITQLKNIATVSKELNLDFGTVWHQKYENKEYGNDDFDKVESIYGEGRDMIADMLDISNMAGRLEDYIGKKRMSEKIKMRTILFISASPEDQDRIRVDQEISKIEEQFDSSKNRNVFKIIKKEASKITTITKEILDNHPEIIHFSGHGDIDGIVLENDDNTHALIPSSALEILFGNLAQKLEVLIINACYSDGIAEHMSKNGCYTIGMSDSINDKDAINFSIGFYQAIGAGTNVEDAFKTALVVMSQNPTSMNIPRIWKDGIELK